MATDERRPRAAAETSTGKPTTAGADRPGAGVGTGTTPEADARADVRTAEQPLDPVGGGASGRVGHAVEEIAAAWERERPGTPVSSIGIVTPIWRLAKLLGDDRRRVLAGAGVDAATLDLLSVLRRSGAPYVLGTRELGRRSLVTAGAVSQRVARAEREGLVVRRAGSGRTRSVEVELTEAGHALVEATVDRVLGREAQLIDGLTPEQQTQLAGLLAILFRDVQARLGDDRLTHVGDADA